MTLATIALLVVVGLAPVLIVLLILARAREWSSRKPFAHGWRVRCPECGHHRPAAELGITRAGGSGSPRIPTQCSRCGESIWAVLERDPDRSSGET